jgi:ankyrin repeat protein
MTLVYQAAGLGHCDMMRLLQRTGVDINKSDLNDCTGLHAAAREGNHDIVELLIELGVNVNKAWTFGRAHCCGLRKGDTRQP